MPPSTRRSPSQSDRPRAAETLTSRTATHRSVEAEAAVEEEVAPPRPRRAWLACFYLCGDYPDISSYVAANVRSIEEAGEGAELHVAVHWDRPPEEGGAVQYVLGDVKPMRLGIVNTGESAPLRRFLTWAIERCPADRVALVIGGIGIFQGLTEVTPDPGADPSRAYQWSQLFSICDDGTAHDALDLFDLAAALREVRKCRETELAVDLAVFDVCDSGFIEVAAELEGLVGVTVAPQTRVPIQGIAYEELVGAWKELSAQGAGPKELGVRVAEIAERSYRKAGDPGCAVTALDLGQLHRLLRAFDVFTIALVQFLGETLVWRARAFVFQDGERYRVQGHGDKDYVYDLDALLESIADRMGEIASLPRTSWLDERAAAAVGTRRRYWPLAIARELEKSGAAEEDLLAAATALRGREARKDPPHVLPGWILDRERGGRLEERLEPVLERISARLPRDVRDELDLLPLQQAHAGQLATLARKVRELLAREAGLVLRGPTPAADGAATRGLSIYRPVDLDELRDLSYLGLRFHHSVHWSVYLAACNLITDHATALWRVLTSLLATASPAGRGDVVRAMTGRDSLLIGFRRQLRGLSQPPCVSITLDRETTSGAANARVYYRLRIDSAERGATLEQQQNRVQPRSIDRLLAELDELLESPSLDAERVARIQAIGDVLGQDVLQGRAGKTLADLESIRALEALDREAVSDAPAAPERSASPDGHRDEPIHLQLQLPLDLMRYPWELLHDSKGWIGDRFAIARAVFMEAGGIRRSNSTRSGGIRALVIGAPLLEGKRRVDALPGAVLEARAVAAALASAAESLGPLVDFDPERDVRIEERVTCRELRNLLKNGRYDLVHFAGHGVFKPNDPEASAWLLSDDELTAYELARTLAGSERPPWLIYANACQSSKEAGASRYHGEVYSLATTCLSKGVSAYIGSLAKIGDDAASLLAEKFYQGFLLSGMSLGAALWRARGDVKSLVVREGRPAPNGLGWLGLTLYGDPTAGLMQLLGSRTPRLSTLGGDARS